MFPTLGVTLFRLGHPQQNAFPFFVALAGGEIAVNLRSLYFGAPVPFDDIDRLGFWTFLWFAVFHRAQLAGSMTAGTGETFAFICCAMITTATEPMINPAPTSVRNVSVSCAKRVPRRMATMGFT